MKTNLKVEIHQRPNGEHIVKTFDSGLLFGITSMTLDEVEDLEMQLTDIIKVLQDYRLMQSGN